ncbi:MAG: hypothetical protein IJP48_04880 [Synergistaceae bacterium]|nr:hypothetical protein [Synergistaceae bacterium]
MLRKIYRTVVPKFIRLFIRRFINKIRVFCSNVKEFSKEYHERKINYSYCILLCDWLMCYFFLGTSTEDYFIYKFYDKSWRQCSQFVTLRRSRFLIASFNNGSEDERILVEDKTIFSDVFKDFTKRKTLSSENLSEEKFKAFLNELGRVIIKPADGYNGNDIYILKASDSDEDIRRAYESFSSHKYTIEEVLEQDGIMRELNPGTLNTMRVNVINNHGSFEIQNAILRSGQGDKPVDNICAGGVVSWIDVDTGIVISPFCDLMNKRVISHPLTGTIMIGKKIPLWERVKEAAIEGAKRISKVKYTSWDIAVIKNEDVAIVEGNTYGNFNIQQVITQNGLWKHYRRYL